MNDAFAVSRMRENRPSGSMRRGQETERWTILNGHEVGNGGHSQDSSCTPPRRPSTRPVSKTIYPRRWSLIGISRRADNDTKETINMSDPVGSVTQV